MKFLISKILHGLQMLSVSFKSTDHWKVNNSCVPRIFNFQVSQCYLSDYAAVFLKILDDVLLLDLWCVTTKNICYKILRVVEIYEI